MKILASFIITVFLSILLATAYYYYAPRLEKLPQPPQNSRLILILKASTLLKEHVADCKECVNIHLGPLNVAFRPCDKYFIILDEALTIDNWRLTTSGWQWIGPQLVWYYWDLKEQKWEKKV